MIFFYSNVGTTLCITVLSMLSPSCIFIPGWIPHRASVHTSVVGYNDSRARLWLNLRGYVRLKLIILYGQISRQLTSFEPERGAQGYGATLRKF